MNANVLKKGVKPIAGGSGELVRLKAVFVLIELANQAGWCINLHVNGKAHVRLDGSSFSTVYKDYKGEKLWRSRVKTYLETLK